MVKVYNTSEVLLNFNTMAEATSTVTGITGTDTVIVIDKLLYGFNATGAITTGDGRKWDQASLDGFGISAKQLGCTTGGTAAANLAIIEAGLLTHTVIRVEADIPWDKANLSSVPGTTIYDEATGGVIHRQIAIEPSTTGTSHVVVRSVVDDAVSQMWLMPNGNPNAAGVATWTPAGVKVFHEDYKGLGEVDYRDGGFTAEQQDGHNGYGCVRFNSKSNGNMLPWEPDLHMTFQGGRDIMLKATYGQAKIGAAGNYFAGGLYEFEPGFPIWRAGISVTQSQLVNMYGRIYEAQSTGTTGSTALIHATYELRTLEVASSTGYVVGEVVRQTTGTLPNGYVESIVDATHIRLKWENAASLAGGWTASDPVIGDDSATSSNLVGDTTGNVNYDEASTSYKPFGPPVSGRIVSDGSINFMFLNDVKNNVPGNDPLIPTLLLGKAATVPLPYEQDMSLQVGDQDMTFHPAWGAMFPKDGDSTDRFRVFRDTTTDNLRITFPSGNYLDLDDSNDSVKGSGVVWAADDDSKTSGATTKDATGFETLLFNDSSATSFTGLTGGVKGQRVDIKFETANTTLVHGANFKLTGAVNFTPAAETLYSFKKITGSIWYQVG